METLTTCPRGHALADNAVYCTVCWIRVEPETFTRVDARKRRRRRLLVGIPLVGAGAVIVGVVLGNVLATQGGGSVAAMATAPPLAVASAADTVTVAEQPVAEQPVAEQPVAEQPVAVSAAPLAARVAEPVAQDPVSPECVAAVRGGQVPCAVTGDRLEFAVCVPGETNLIRVGTRPNDNVTFHNASSAVALGASGDCAVGDLAAQVTIDAYSPAATWRIVGRNAADKKIWKSRVVTLPASP